MISCKVNENMVDLCEVGIQKNYHKIVMIMGRRHVEHVTELLNARFGQDFKDETPACPVM